MRTRTPLRSPYWPWLTLWAIGLGGACIEGFTTFLVRLTS
jgi:hypothetical protein